MFSIIKYLSARSRLKNINSTISSLGDNCDNILLAQREMTECETTFYYYKTISDIIFILFFVALCGIIYGATDEEDLRTLWSGVCSWYAQTVAWGQLQAETIYQSISK